MHLLVGNDGIGIVFDKGIVEKSGKSYLLTSTGRLMAIVLYNLYNNEGGNILFTADFPPTQLNISLPDLKSRLNVVPAIRISAPDDELLSALIIKLFMDRQITVSLDIVKYILVNMQRSFIYAQKLVDKIDNISLAYKRAISISIVKEAINELNNDTQRDFFL